MRSASERPETPFREEALPGVAARSGQIGSLWPFLCDCEPSDTRARISLHPIVWEGEVLVFDLIRHPTAATAYAWSVGQQVTAVLHEGPVDSPQAAVTAARRKSR